MIIDSMDGKIFEIIPGFNKDLVKKIASAVDVK